MINILKNVFDVFGADKIAQFNIQAGEELNVFLMWMPASGMGVGSTVSVRGK